MDFGTMTVKVSRGKYRSLDDFASDLRLVTGNAKLFNPPGSIHYTEAERIEAYGLSHIAKATNSVIQYEADWNIDIEHDEENSIQHDDDDEDMAVDTGTPAPTAGGTRSPSPSSGFSRGGRRGGPGRLLRQAPPTVKKDKEETSTVKPTISETLDENGHLPGAKDGVGIFPACSDLARTMLEIKLKKKGPKTKKERLRLEKVGNIYNNDGSLAFTEMKDPFSLVSIFQPEPMYRPTLNFLYDPSLTKADDSGPASSFPPTITLPPEAVHVSVPPPPSGLKHWNVSRNAINRQRAQDREREQRDREREQTAFDDKDPLMREAGVFDYGSFSVLAAQLDTEMRKRGFSGALSGKAKALPASAPKDLQAKNEELKYWKTKAAEAETYIRDTVYGGLGGLAYSRSLAEFISPEDHAPSEPNRNLDGLSLSEYVSQRVLDPLTEGRHSVLQETASQLVGFQDRRTNQTSPETITQALSNHSKLAQSIEQLIALRAELIDMSALVKGPDEFFLSEQEWVGRRHPHGAMMMAEEDPVISSASKQDDAMDVDGLPSIPAEIPLDQVFPGTLKYNASLIDHLITKRQFMDMVKSEEGENLAAEEKVMKHLRMNLLALAKRAPIDKVSKLPKELVPPHIRSHVPIIESS
jgi:bromodomain-containing protein 7/9